MIRYEAIHAVSRIKASPRPMPVIGHRWVCDKCRETVHTEKALALDDGEDTATQDARVARIKDATESHVCRTGNED